MNLKSAYKKRDRFRRGRARQYRKWKATGKAGHLRRFRKLQAEIAALNEVITAELQRRKLSRVYSREEWGAADPRGAFALQVRLVAGVQHHTAMPTLPASASVAEEMARMRQLQSIHQIGNGWTDIGYGLVVFPSGRIYEGRPARYVGAHTLGHNTGYAGWALDGNFEVDRPTKAAVESCRRARKILGAEAVPLFGHFELNPTSCPGRYLRPHLRRDI